MSGYTPVQAVTLSDHVGLHGRSGRTAQVPDAVSLVASQVLGLPTLVLMYPWRAAI